MRIMYKEVVTRRKTPFMAAMLLGLVMMIVISNIVEQIKVSNYEIGSITNPVFFVITTIVITLQLIKCKVKYKYSIIANQLIIHRLKNDKQSVVENIRIEDIVFIGKTKDIKSSINKNIKKAVNSISSKRYVCSMSMFNQYCCIYRYGDKYKRFYFEPSREFIKRIQVN